MILLETVSACRDWRSRLHPENSLGFVPTMGALHQGHLSIVERAAGENDSAAVSIFVNPIQFNSSEDLHAYPRNLSRDLDLCEKAGAAAVFAPQAADMFPPGHSTFCLVEGLDTFLCGAGRPGHFRGVCTIVLKLLNIIQPHAAYFGRKDFQQARIVQQMASDLHLNAQILTAETVREPSGLAMSSRNLRLSPEEKARAVAIYKGLCHGRSLLDAGTGSSPDIIAGVREVIAPSRPDSIEYISIVDTERLQPIKTVSRPALLAAAVVYGGVRLIDNVLLEPGA